MCPYTVSVGLDFPCPIDPPHTKLHNKPNPTHAQAAAATRLVTQLGLLLDDATSPERNRRYDPRILIVGATNRPHGIHPALRRPGRLDKEVCRWACICMNKGNDTKWLHRAWMRFG